MIKGNFSVEKTDLLESLVTLTDPPPINKVKPEPPKPPAVKPPPIKSQIQFVPPVVKKDKDVPDVDEKLPPTITKIDSSLISNKPAEGDPGGIDPILENPKSIDPSFVEEPKAIEKPFAWVEQMPSFPDGEKAMYEYIYKHISYPLIARESNIAGKVVVQFVVSKEGDIQNVHVLNGIGGGCNEEAMRVIRGMPRWKPGKNNGEAVPVTYTLPIRFELR